jgi:hypothetical protein
MKTNIGKLAVFVVIATWVVFMTVASALANDNHWGNTIEGEYAFTGAGSCLIAIAGFDNSFQPIGGADGPWFGGPVTIDEGIYKFKKDGSGSVKAILREADLYSTSLGAPPSVGSATESYDFTYTVAKNGRMNFTYVTGTYDGEWITGPNVNSKLYLILPPWNGFISPDGNTFYASFGTPGVMNITLDKANTILPGVQAVCNIDFHGFRIEE